MTKTKTFHFRVHTPNFLKEIIEGYPAGNVNVLQVPMSIFRGLLAQVATRCAEIDDPVLNRLMFDLALYELPSPTSEEYGKLMKTLYRKEQQYLKAKIKNEKEKEKNRRRTS